MIDYGYNQAEICWGAAGQMDDAAVRRVCQVIKDLGGSRIRMAVQLGTWADLDRAVNIAFDEFHLKPLLCIINNPQFGYNGTPAGFAAMCKAVALRYGPAGSNKVTEYELFNEENSSLNAPAVGDPASFTAYLKAGYTAVKSVHTSSTVICGGTIPAPDTWIPFIGTAMDPVDWYRGIYAAGGKDFMDALGFHLYATGPPSPAMVQWTYLTDLRQVMIENGDTAKKVWISEVGVGFPAPGVQNLVMARDWLKIMVEGMLALDYVSVLFIYNTKNYSAGDGAGGTYGMVDINYVPRSPVYEYAATIAGTPSDPLDIVPPSAPTDFVVTTVGPRSGIASWGPATDDVGVTVYKIYNAADDTVIAQTTQIGQISTVISGLTPGTPYVAYAKAFDAAGNPSAASNTFPFTTDAPSGSQAFFQYDFTGSGSAVPPGLVPLGLGLTVALGVALPNAPTADGSFLTVSPWTMDQESPDHSSQVGVSAASTNPYLAALSLIRMSPDGSQFAGAMITGGGQADACKIFTYSGGKLTIRDACNATPLLPGEYLEMLAEGNVYVATRIRADGSRADLLPWTDTNSVYPGATNRRTGLGWWHRRVGGVNYPPPGITGLWKANDLNAVVVPDVGNADLWKIAITKKSRLGFVASTGLWQAAL